MSYGLGALDSAVSSMSRSYTEAQSKMATSLQRIASGKRFQTASQDLAGYSDLTGYEVNNAAYQRIKTDLTEAKANVSAILDAANNMMDDYVAAKALFADGQDAAAAEIITGIADQLTAVGEGGIAFVKGNWGTIDTIGTVGVDLDLSGNLADVDGAETTEGEVDTSIGQLETWLGKVTGLLAVVESQERLAQVSIENTEALASALTEIDEAAELANVVDQDIRQQASLAMVAQANMSRRNVAILYR